MTVGNGDVKLVLFRGWPETGHYVWSPFVTKVEFRLRFGSIPYSTEAGSPTKAPKGKIPYVHLSSISREADGQNQYFADSTLIINELVQRGHLHDLNRPLSDRDKTTDLAVRALLEDKLYFYHTRERWIDNYYVHRDKTLWSMPLPVRFIVGNLIYRNITQTLHGQGVGRFSSEEIDIFKREIWENISKTLEWSRRGSSESQPFWLLGGEEATEADAVLFGFVVSVLVAESGPQSKKIVKQYPVLTDYATRIHNRWFPDYEKWS